MDKKSDKVTTGRGQGGNLRVQIGMVHIHRHMHTSTQHTSCKVRKIDSGDGCTSPVSFFLLGKLKSFAVNACFVTRAQRTRTISLVLLLAER